MNFAAQNQIITVDQGVDEGFKNTSLTIFRYFNSGVGCFLSTDFHIPFYKSHTFIQQNNFEKGIDLEVIF